MYTPPPRKQKSIQQLTTGELLQLITEQVFTRVTTRKQLLAKGLCSPEILSDNALIDIVHTFLQKKHLLESEGINITNAFKVPETNFICLVVHTQVGKFQDFDFHIKPIRHTKWYKRLFDLRPSYRLCVNYTNKPVSPRPKWTLGYCGVAIN